MLRTAMGLRSSGTDWCCVFCTHKRNGNPKHGVARDDVPEEDRNKNLGFETEKQNGWIGKVRSLAGNMIVKHKGF